MSWYVKALIVNSSDIRSTQRFDSDTYMSLLVLERKIQDLFDRELLSQQEYDAILSMSNTKSVTASAEKLGVARITLSRIFTHACNKIAYYLGDIYTDSGYANYIKKEYKLNLEEENKLLDFILKDELKDGDNS